MKAFTLIEILVVIVIIGILISIAAVLVPWIIDREKTRNTESFILVLKSCCEVYRQQNGAWPPNDAGGLSKSLHYYLSREQAKFPPNLASVKPPYTIFKQNQIDGGGPLSPASKAEARDLIDAWGLAMTYKPPVPLTNPIGGDMISAGKDNQTGTPDDLNTRTATSN